MLFLNSNGTVKAEQRLDSSSAGLGGVVGGFGSSLAALGDVDGDGLGDLAVGEPGASGLTQGNGKGAVWVVRLANDGTPASTLKIGDQVGGFGGTLAGLDAFGTSIAALGDLDGDGNLDLAVGSPKRAPGPGELWILFLDSDQTVRSERRLTQLEVLGRTGRVGFGTALAPFGDANGDGTPDLVAGIFGRAGASGGFLSVFLERDGAVTSMVEIAPNLAGFQGGGPAFDFFGYALANLGDLDGDGWGDLAVGAPFADTSLGVDSGAVWILNMQTFSPNASVRNGNELNPYTLEGLQRPRLGGSWDVRMDCSRHAAGLALVRAHAVPLAALATPVGELLLDVTSPRLLAASVARSGNQLFDDFSFAVPNDPALAGLSASMQGGCTGFPGPQLGNAIDVVITQ